MVVPTRILDRIMEAEHMGAKELDLSNANLTSLPESIGNLTNLVELNLRGNSLTSLPESIGNLVNLASLNLSGNNLFYLPKSLPNLTCLAFLDLSYAGLTSFLRVLTNLASLTSLNLSGNRLRYFSKNIFNLTNLVSLNLSDTDVTTLHENICDLTNLASLDLSENRLSSLPNSMVNLTRLTYLNISGNRLEVLPNVLMNLPKLTGLGLGSNRMRSFPENIFQLVKLTDLDLSSTGLTSSSRHLTDLTKLSNLTSLNLSNNRLMSVPMILAKLSKLTSLNLSNNRLKILPKMLNNLLCLKNLDLSGNSLTSIPDRLTNLTNITFLNLSENNLTSVPERFSSLTNLASLDLSYNELNTLPECIVKINSLTSLDLSCTGLTSLPANISNLTSLARLHIEGNLLMSLPASIGKIISLTDLCLRNNKLTSLPSSIVDLVNLASLDLRGNHLPFPPEIVSRPTDVLGILAYLRQFYMSPDANRSMNEAKVILVGEAKAGKTSLIKRLVKNQFDPNEPKTEGIDIHLWHLDNVHCVYQDETIDETGRTVRLNIWDLGGQEIYHATHQFFLTERTLYLLVLSARLTDEQNRLHYWLKTIRTLGKDAPVLIIHNHHESNPEQLDRKTLREKYPSIGHDGFIETSCPDETLKGIDTLRNAIRREIGKMRHVSDPLPPTYFAVKERLEEETRQRDFVNSDEYRELCNEVGVDSSEERHSILGLLHALGTVVSFQDDLRLRDTNVLNPEWVTEGVYSVLDDLTLKAQGDGLLQIDVLSAILAKAKRFYPPNKHIFILDMMIRFELCFAHPGKYGEYLIPEMLAPVEPDDIGDFHDALRFELQYDFLPRSVLPRFIVGTHLMLQTYRWRNGVVIESSGSRALVRADIEANKVTIAITGNEKTRRDLLSILRGHFAQIHQTPETLNAKERIPLTDYPDAEPVPYDFLRELEDDGETHFRWHQVRERLSVAELLSGIERTRRPISSTGSNRKGEDTMVPPTPMSVATSVPPDPPTRNVLLARTDILNVAPDNAQYLNALAEQGERGRIVPFVGAGMTIALGMPGWGGALEAIFNNAKPNLTIDEAMRYATAKATNQWEEMAQALWEVDKLGERWFNSQIKALFGKHKLPTSPAQITGAISLLPRFARGPVLTTNFDAALEHVYAAAGQEFTRDETVLGDYRAHEVIERFDMGGRFLLKLHGDADESWGRVLTRDQYDRAYGKGSKLPELLISLFGSRRPLLFLGCSLLTDRTLTELKKAGLGQTIAYHFALVELPATTDERIRRQGELIAQYGIQPIWFAKGDFAAIERVLQFLADVRAVKP